MGTLDKWIEKAKKEWKRFLKRIKLDMDSPTPETPVAPVAFPDVSKPFLGYMLVNNWSIQDSKTVLRQLAANSIQCAPFEFFEWSSPAKFAQTDELIKAFQDWIDASQETKTVLYVTLYNANLGSGKYGDAGISADKYDAQIRKVAAKFAEWSKKYSNVYLTPSGEGESAYDRKIQDLCKTIIPLNRLVNNWTARPTGTDGMGFYCQHPSNTGASFGKAAWVMSDHSTLINQLNGGTGLYGQCHYETTKAYAEKCLKAGNPFIYYHFDKNGKIDATALKALRDAWQAVQGASPTIPDNPSPTPVPVPSGDIDLSSAKWHGVDGRQAKVTESISNLTFDGKYFYYSPSKGTESWQPFNPSQKNCNQIACFFVYRGGQYMGGKFDWSTYSRKSRESKNIRDGYTGGIIPVNGEKVWFLLTDLNGKNRTNALPVIWK